MAVGGGEGGGGWVISRHIYVYLYLRSTHAISAAIIIMYVHAHNILVDRWCSIHR